MIYSRTEEMANKLRKAFKDRKVKKKYLVITKGIPSLKEGRLTSTFQAIIPEKLIWFMQWQKCGFLSLNADFIAFVTLYFRINLCTCNYILTAYVGVSFPLLYFRCFAVRHDHSLLVCYSRVWTMSRIRVKHC